MLFCFVSKISFSFCKLTSDRKGLETKHTEKNDTAFDQPKASVVTEFLTKIINRNIVEIL